MPTKKTTKTKTTKTKKPVYVKNNYGQKYRITKTELKEVARTPYRAKLAYIGQITSDRVVLSDKNLLNSHSVPFYIGNGANSVEGYADVYVGDTYISIGCQTYIGINARKIIRAANAAANKVAKKAKSAGVGA